jgi:hypothetical protein
VIRAHRQMTADPALVPITQTSDLDEFTLEKCQAYDPEPYCTASLTLDPPVPQDAIEESTLPCRRKLTAHSTPSGDGHDYYYTEDSQENCQNNLDFMDGVAEKPFIAPAWTRPAYSGYIARHQCDDAGVSGK